MHQDTHQIIYNKNNDTLVIKSNKYMINYTRHDLYNNIDFYDVRHKNRISNIIHYYTDNINIYKLIIGSIILVICECLFFILFMFSFFMFIFLHIKTQNKILIFIIRIYGLIIFSLSFLMENYSAFLQYFFT